MQAVTVSADGRLQSDYNWYSHLFWGQPGRSFQLWLGRSFSDVLTYHWILRICQVQLLQYTFWECITIQAEQVFCHYSIASLGRCVSHLWPNRMAWIFGMCVVSLAVKVSTQLKSSLLKCSSRMAKRDTVNENGQSQWGKKTIKRTPKIIAVQ